MSSLPDYTQALTARSRDALELLKGDFVKLCLIDQDCYKTERGWEALLQLLPQDRGRSAYSYLRLSTNPDTRHCWAVTIEMAIIAGTLELRKVERPDAGSEIITREGQSTRGERDRPVHSHCLPVEHSGNTRKPWKMSFSNTHILVSTPKYQSIATTCSKRPSACILALVSQDYYPGALLIRCRSGMRPGRPVEGR